MTPFIIYGLVDPRTHQLRYIGKSSSGTKRPSRHGMNWYLTRDTTWKGRWVRELKAAGYTYGIVVLHDVGDTEVLRNAEIFWIAYFRNLGCPLTNLTDGGDSGPKHPEHRRKISASHKRNGHRPSQEALKKAIEVRDHAWRLRQSKAKGGRPFIDQHGTIYPTIHEAARLLKLSPGNIHSVLSGRYKHTGGYIFKWQS